jgi:hypothetical protein
VYPLKKKANYLNTFWLVVFGVTVNLLYPLCLLDLELSSVVYRIIGKVFFLTVIMVLRTQLVNGNYFSQYLESGVESSLTIIIGIIFFQILIKPLEISSASSLFFN